MSSLLSQLDENLTPPISDQAWIDLGPAVSHPALQTNNTLIRSGPLFLLIQRTATASGNSSSVYAQPQLFIYL